MQPTKNAECLMFNKALEVDLKKKKLQRDFVVPDDGTDAGIPKVLSHRSKGEGADTCDNRNFRTCGKQGTMAHMVRYCCA